MKKNRKINLLLSFFFIIILLLMTQDSYAAFSSGEAIPPDLEPDVGRSAVDTVPDLFDGLMFTFPELPDTFYTDLEGFAGSSSLTFGADMGARAYTNGSDVFFPQIEDYSHQLREYTQEHQSEMTTFTGYFSDEARRVGYEYTDAMTQSFTDMGARSSTFYNSTDGFEVTANARSSSARNLIVEYTDVNNDFDTQASTNSAAVAAAEINFNNAVAALSSIDPSDTTAIAAARSNVEVAGRAYGDRVRTDLEHRFDSASDEAAAVHAETESGFADFAGDDGEIDDVVMNVGPRSIRLRTDVIFGLGTHDSAQTMDPLDIMDSTPGEPNRAAYDIANRIYTDIETEMFAARNDGIDTADQIRAGRRSYRIYGEAAASEHEFDAALSTSGDRFYSRLTTRNNTLEADIDYLSGEFAAGRMSRRDYENNVTARVIRYKDDYSSDLLGGRATLEGHVTDYVELAKGRANDYHTSLDSRCTDVQSRAPAVRRYITDRANQYQQTTQEEIIDYIDDAVYLAVQKFDQDLVNAQAAGEEVSFAFSSLNKPRTDSDGNINHWFFDPPVAVGYEYEVISGPNFSTVSPVPVGSDTFFELWLFDTSNDSFIFDRNLEAIINSDPSDPYHPGNPISYMLNMSDPDVGVGRFRLLGIDPEESLSFGSPFAFSTGLAFVDDLSNAQMRMTPITRDYNPNPSNPVPEPATLILFSIGLVGAFIRKRFV